MSASKANPCVPIEIFDEHNQAFYCWHMARHDGRIDKPIDLLHVDAHSDMGTPERLQASLFFPAETDDSYQEYYRSLADNELSIDNFIVPAVLNRIIKSVYFIPPKWRKMKSQRKQLNVASAFGEGYVLKHNLKAEQGHEQRISAAYPDLTEFTFFVINVEKIPKNREVILDIDLDYFACVDSIANAMQYELEITRRQFESKDRFFKENRNLQYSLLEFHFFERNGRYYAKIGRKKGKDISYLPPVTDIEAEIARVVDTLRDKNVRPALITICRSCVSGFCPPDYGTLVENKLLQSLRMWIDDSVVSSNS